MRVLVTGHTGFKGAWLTLMLKRAGHEVVGLALNPEPGSLFESADVSSSLAADARVDVRDADAVRDAFASVVPEVVVHMAAQPLVRASYVDPRWTIETNVMGTLSVLEAISSTPSVRAALIVTTDKVYRNVGQELGYVEHDALGGHDPYSASKAMADILTSSWVSSFDCCPIAIARAGNVIGGGDVSKDRLFPDLIRAFASGEPASLRYPGAVRPWQHVLDCLNGYMMLIDALLARGDSAGGAWNIGPDPSALRAVDEAASLAASLWGPGASWQAAGGQHPHEAGLLTLDATRARIELGWHDLLDFSSAVEWTVDWAKRVSAGESAREVTLSQIEAFMALD